MKSPLASPWQDLAEPEKLRHAMLGVDHEVARLQIDEVGRKRRERGLGCGRARHQLRSLEQVLRAEDQRASNRGTPRRAGRSPFTR